jgi:hypothetical protein
LLTPLGVRLSELSDFEFGIAASREKGSKSKVEIEALSPDGREFGRGW